MPHRPLIGLALLACLATALSCAVTDAPNTAPPLGYDAPPVQSAARMGLPAPYRAFYDALEGEGDWALIEPFGWVFRPAVNFDSWRPYQQGWWEPSDVYGWVWNSIDPFGWVTDHYGSWFFDPYQGWVWQPGPVWGPAWVAWIAVGDYVGWAPLAPAEYHDFSRVPSHVFTFAPAQQFGGMQSNSQALFVARPPRTDERVSEISNPTRRDGVVFNRGPDFDLLQRLGGPVAPRPEEPSVRRLKLPPVQAPGESDLLLRTRRLVAAGVEELARGRVGAPEPAGGRTKAPAPEPQAAPGGKGAPPDSADARAKDPRRGSERPRRPGDAPGRHGAQPDSTKR